MNKIERIQQMEKHLNEYGAALEAAKQSLKQLQEAQAGYIQLRDYYSSPDFLEDVDFSNSRDFPRDIPCGVLSEDAVYDLLDEHFQLGLELLEQSSRMLRER